MRLGGVLLAAMILALQASAAHGQTSRCTWRAVEPARVAGGGLYGVAAVSKSDIWAVGAYSNRTTLLEHWDGRRWKVAGPRLRGSLLRVSSSSSSNVWAVGAADVAATKPLILRFDGRHWSRVPLTLPGGRRGWLADVVALAGNHVWVVGSAGLPPPRPDERGLAAHWNGQSWSFDLLGTATLLGVDGRRGSETWAVGGVEDIDQPPYVEPTLERRRGGDWTSVDPGFTDDLNAVKVLAGGRVWVVGGKFGTATYQLAAYFDGAKWTRRRPGAKDSLFDVDATAPNDMWAAGDGDLVHWNGERWKRTPVAAQMTGIDALSARNVWAVGTGRRAVIRHYSC